MTAQVLFFLKKIRTLMPLSPSCIQCSSPYNMVALECFISFCNWYMVRFVEVSSDVATIAFSLQLSSRIPTAFQNKGISWVAVTLL